MEHRCATCGQILPEYGGIVADRDRGEVRFAGKMVRNLTGREFELFRYLLDRAGRVATHEEILFHIYQLNEDVEIKIVDVFICKLRAKLKPLGLEIATLWGVGYRLVEPVREDA